MPIEPLTRPYGKRGQIEYKPNWGQPIVDGQWRGQSQPTSQAIDPSRVVNTKLDQLWTNYQQQFKALESANLDTPAFNRIASGMRNEYDQAKGELTGITSQLDLIRRGVTSGELDPVAAREAELRLTVPEYRPPTPTRPEPRGRFTPGEVKSYIEDFQDRIESTIVNPWGWGKAQRKYADPDALKEQYFSARAQYAYDTDMNTDERKAFDLTWDQAIAGNKKTQIAWKKALKEDPELFTSRTYDARLMNIAAAKARGSVSPMAKHVQSKVFVSQRTRRAGPWAPSQFFGGEQTAEDFTTMSNDELMRIAGGR